MGKFDGYLLLSDIDGTLTDSKGKLPQSNADAIHYFQSEGGLFTVASGRFPDFIDGFSSSVKPNTHIIGINGTVIYDWQNKKDLVCRTLDEKFISLVYDIIETRPELDSVYISHRFDNVYIPVSYTHPLLPVRYITFAVGYFSVADMASFTVSSASIGENSSSF